MEWAELRAAVRKLQSDQEMTATAVAGSGAALLHRTLNEMYLGEPEALRAVVWAIAQARPNVVALRNVGVAVFRTATEARVGDRMAAATRAALRLTRLLGQTPQALGRRGQSLLDEQATVVTLGYSTAVHAALVQGKERITRVTTLESGHENGRLVHELEEEGPPAHTLPLADVDEALKAAQVVLLGCSAFLADGSIVAEAGALELVQKAAAKKIPVHFFADTLKLAPWLPPSKTSDGKRPLWELVPPIYIDHVITEDGIRRPNQLLQAAADLAPRWRALEPSS